MTRPIGWCGLAVLSCLSLTCDDPVQPDRRVPRTIGVRPDSQLIRVNYNLQMYAVVLDAEGDSLPGRVVTWESSDPTRVFISSTGLATGRAPGPVTITARLDTIAGSAALRVLIPVARVTVTPSTVTLVPDGTLMMSAVLTGTEGSTLSDRDVTWIHQTAAISIDPSGVVTGLEVGQDSVSAASEGVTSWNRSRVTVTQPVFTRLVSGERAVHTCGIAAEGRAFCWGAHDGRLGNGTRGTAGLSYPTGVADLDGLTAIAMGFGFSCGIDESRLFCWGNGGEYQLGTGTLDDHLLPIQPINAPAVTAVAAGADWACALGVDSLPYCWGGNVGPRTPEPLGARRYIALFAGNHILCGIGTDSLTYCGSRGSASLVSPTLRFTTLAVGFDHTCGITTDSLAYCWGLNGDGELGDGTRDARDSPTLVAGGMQWVGIATGHKFSCGIAAASLVAHCWGLNQDGGLGRGTPAVSDVPLPVSGDLTLTQIVAGTAHACGIATSGQAYCWGWNADGQLGDGTRVDRFAPVRVAGQP